MKFMILGATGMAGHTISLYLLSQGHEVITISRRAFSYGKNLILNAFDTKQLGEIISHEKPEYIVNCLGILNEHAENKKDEAVFINSYIPHFLETLTQETQIKVIHLSTDCVFSGKLGQYHENAVKDGSSYYDCTKALGEIVNSKDLTFRNSIIGPDMNEQGIGLFNWFMKQKQTILGYTNAYWNGITTLQLAKAIESACKQNLTGLYQITPNEFITKFNLIKLFKKYTEKPIHIIPFENQYMNKTLVNTRKDFNFSVPNYEIMIKEMIDWINSHQALYPHYWRGDLNE